MIHLLATKAPRHELCQDDPRYPKGLFHVEQPPPCVRTLGSVETLALPSLAIVGARKATPYGLNCAKRFARLAALQGIVIVSGGAIGCDQAAHQGALEAGGRTIVVLGCGADVIYPFKASELFLRILEEDGTLISEAPWSSPPSRWGFIRRNRIIAGLAQATLIVEAGLPSGTFSTADATLAQGKEVLAVPGSIFAKESKGANRLIVQGAVPIIDDESFTDALLQLFGIPELFPTPWGARPGARPGAKLGTAGPFGFDTTQVRVLDALAQEPLRAEALQGICGDDVIEVIRYLSSLELAGLVGRLRDGRYAAVSH